MLAQPDERVHGEEWVWPLVKRDETQQLAFQAGKYFCHHATRLLHHLLVFSRINLLHAKKTDTEKLFVHANVLEFNKNSFQYVVKALALRQWELRIDRVAVGT